MVIVASVLWGISGTVAQALFHHYHFTTEWLTSARLVFSGMILLLVSLVGEKRQNVWQIIRSKGEFARLVVFGILGLMAVQYTFFLSIAKGNAATATLLQYLGPVFMTVFLILRYRQLPTAKQVMALLLALLGTFLLITNGNPGKLSIAPGAVFWGLVSGVVWVFYTLYPLKLLANWGATVVLGWGMLIGGIGMSLVSQPWQTTGQIWELPSVMAIVFNIVFGTVTAFYLYLDSMRFIKPSETGVLASVEPLAAVVATVVWLHVPFGVFEWVGALCIMGTVMLLATAGEKKKAEVPLEQHVQL
jgi:drug/metabolite transporter (DMT)-like permease